METTEGSGTVRRMPLARRPESARVARRWLRERLREWGLQPLEDSCLIVTSELVTNAVLHGGEPIQVCLALRGEELVIAVSDSQHELPPSRREVRLMR